MRYFKKLKDLSRISSFFALAVLFLASCASNSVQPDFKVLVPQDIETPSDPLVSERLNNGGMSNRELHSEILAEIQSCMRKKGWDQFVSYPSLRPSPDGKGTVEKGFGISFPRDRRAPVSPNDSWLNQMDSQAVARFQTDLFGAGENESDFKNSCMHLAELAAMKNSSVFDVSVGKVVDEAGKLMKNDPRYVRAWSDWSKCMKSSGYDAKDEAQAASQVQASFDATFPGYGLKRVETNSGVETQVVGLKDKKKVEEFQNYEIAVRSAADECLKGISDTLGRLETAYALSAKQALTSTANRGGES